MFVKEYENILKELKFKHGSQPNPETILRDLAVEIKAKHDAVKTAIELKKDLVSKIDLVSWKFINMRRWNKFGSYVQR